uniref:Uncharacterized protein n=1 Tax=Rhizophora mucronata TaxID=61149 RepID=A0A2P2Q3X6_RHIMU
MWTVVLPKARSNVSRVISYSRNRLVILSPVMLIIFESTWFREILIL